MLALGLTLVVLGTLGVFLRGIHAVWPAALGRWRILLVEVLVILAWVLGGRAVASLRERSARAAWIAVDPNAAAPAPQLPKAPNAAGAEVVRLASTLGLHVGRPGAAADAPRDPATEAALGTLGSYLDSVVRRADDRPQAAATELRAWLLVQDAAARALERQVVGRGPIEWGARAVDGALGYSPLELLKLHGVLTAGALDRMRAGDAVSASAALEAAGALAAPLRDRLDTPSRLVALILDRRLLGALRMLDPVPPGWEQRLDEIEAHTQPAGVLPREMLELLAEVREPSCTLRGLVLQLDPSPLLGGAERPALNRALVWLGGGAVPLEDLALAVDAEKKRIGTPFYRYVQGPLERPYVGLVAADYALVQARNAAAAATADVCAPSAPAPAAQLAAWSPIVEKDAAPLRLARMSAVLRAELELTRLVARARTLRAQAPAHGWPAELPGTGSKACAPRRFGVQLDAGRAELRLAPSAFAEGEATVAFRMEAR
jgi:hypothetical protein